MIKFASLFSGGGIIESRLKPLGVEVLWGVECDEKIAQVYRLNYPNSNLIVDKIENINNWKEYDRPEILHISPPCQKYSLANPKAGETDYELTLANSVTRCIKTLEPTYITLENVVKFKHSQAYKIIIDCLYELGYWVENLIINFSYYGVPQNRTRFFAIAWKDDRLVLPCQQEKIGWYDAIADLIPEFEKCELTKTQQKALIRKGLQNYLIAEKREKLPAILIKRVQIRKNIATPLPSDPSFTVTSGICTDHRRANRYKFCNVVNSDGVFNINTRALARLQTVPDTYKLTGKPNCDGVAIGNGVPPLFYANLLSQLC